MQPGQIEEIGAEGKVMGKENSSVEVRGDGKTLVGGEVVREEVGGREKVGHEEGERNGIVHHENEMTELKPGIELDLEVKSLSCALERATMLI